MRAAALTVRQSDKRRPIGAPAGPGDCFYLVERWGDVGPRFLGEIGMSGRVLVDLPDGRVVRGYRKTLRRNRRRSAAERLHETNDKLRRRFASLWARDVRACFLLPKELQAFVASGPHGNDIYVWHGFVQVQHGSATQALAQVSKFLCEIARDRPPFAVLVSITSKDYPGLYYSRFVSVNAPIVVSRDEPTLL